MTPPLPQARPYPHLSSPFIIFKYGDGWAIYVSPRDQIVGFWKDEPLEFHTTDACESFIRYNLSWVKDPTAVM